MRGLGILTVVDQVIQQAIAQELMPLYEVQFSDSSFWIPPEKRVSRCTQTGSEIRGRGIRLCGGNGFGEVLRYGKPQQADRGTLAHDQGRASDIADT